MQSSSTTHPENKLSQFTDQKYISIETYRKTGVAVRRPVWFVEENGELFIRTSPRTGKVKQIRNNPKVRIAACTASGKPKGSWVDGEARLIGPETYEHVFALIKKKYGMMHRLVGVLQSFSRSKVKPIGLAIRTS